MDNSELDKKLKAARPPALEADYQEDFPRSVLAQLRSAAAAPAARRHSWWPRLAWALATATCVLLAFALGHWHGREAANSDVLADARVIQETLTLFPHRVRAIVRDEQGMRLVLSQTDDVPASPAIYVRFCDGKNCSSLVTFSGQEIQVAGQSVTVLASADGGVILTGNGFVWSGGKLVGGGKNLTIRARSLGSMGM